jgi:hypothetical protein
MFDHSGLQCGFALFKHVPESGFQALVTGFIIGFHQASKRLIAVRDTEVVSVEDIFGEVQFSRFAFAFCTTEITSRPTSGA